jgi:hypothetical protein
MALDFISIAGVAIGAAIAVWAREDARSAGRQVARLRDALQPFADLVLEADPEDPVPAEGHVHCLIMGDGELGELKCRDFHEAAFAYAITAPRGEG